MPATRIYTTKAFLEADGFDFTTFTDTQVWRMVRKVAARIDTFTRQWFNGEVGEYAMDGRISVLLEHRAKLPFISVTKIETINNRINNCEAPTTPRLQPNYIYDYWGFEALNWLAPGDTTRNLIDANFYVVEGRLIRRLFGVWPGGELPIVVTGALGKVETPKSVITTTTTDVTNVSTSVTVDDITGFRVRDVIDIVGEFEIMRVIVTGTNRIAKTLTFDVLTELAETIPSGAAISTYGAVPQAIEQVAHYLFLDILKEFVTNADAADGGGSSALSLTLKSETVDDYKYEYFSPSETIGDGNFAVGSILTGSPQMDMILSEFSMPGGARML